MICGQQKQPCQSDVLKIRPYGSRPKVMSNQHLVPSLMVKFDRYTFLTRQVEVGRSPAATLGKKENSMGVPLRFLNTPLPRPFSAPHHSTLPPHALHHDQPSGDYETCQQPVAKNRYTSHHVAAVSRPCRERVVSMSRHVATCRERVAGMSRRVTRRRAASHNVVRSRPTGPLSPSPLGHSSSTLKMLRDLQLDGS